MSHIPYGYRIENGAAVIDEKSAIKLRNMFSNFLTGMSYAKSAQEAGINLPHTTVKRMLLSQRYIGDNFYPAIIDADTHERVKAEIARRSAVLDRINAISRKAAERRGDIDCVSDLPDAPKSYCFLPVKHISFSTAAEKAEYMYSQISTI